MSIIRVAQRVNPFAQIDRRVFEDPRLSWKAKGLLGYLLSRPPGWKVRVPDLVKRSRDGREAVYSALSELIAAGYAERIQTRACGRFATFDYVIHEVPLTGFPEAVNSDAAGPDSVAPPAVRPDAENPRRSKREGRKRESSDREVRKTAPADIAREDAVALMWRMADEHALLVSMEPRQRSVFRAGLTGLVEGTNISAWRHDGELLTDWSARVYLWGELLDAYAREIARPDRRPNEPARRIEDLLFRFVIPQKYAPFVQRRPGAGVPLPHAGAASGAAAPEIEYE